MMCIVLMVYYPNDKKTLYFKAAIDTLLWKVMQLSNETTTDENLSFLLPTLLHIIK